MADSRQPAQRVLIWTFFGNVPFCILRYMVERLRPVRWRTALIRRMRSGVSVCIGFTLHLMRLSGAPQERLGMDIGLRKGWPHGLRRPA